MKAVGYTTPGPITNDGALLDFEAPTPDPGAGDLRVAIKAVSVSPVDAKVRAAAAPPPGEVRVLGFDAAGIVDAVGAAVSGFAPGDAVFYSGALDRSGCNREFHLVDARLVGRKPALLSFEQAAAMPLTAITAWELLFDRLGMTRGPSATGTLLVINGVGGVGSILADRRPPADRTYRRHGVAARDDRLVQADGRASSHRQSPTARRGAACDRHSRGGSGRQSFRLVAAQPGDGRGPRAARQARLD